MVGLAVAVLCGAIWGEGPGVDDAERMSGMASARVPAERLQQYSDLAVTWM